MGFFKVREMSSILNIRDDISRKIKENREIMEGKNVLEYPKFRASLVILWGLLIYPLLDPVMKQSQKRISISLDDVYHSFQSHLGTKKRWEENVYHMRKYDYIRLCGKDRITAGSRLWTAVDAAKIYPLFRTSVLARQMSRAINLSGSTKKVQKSSTNTAL